MEAFIDIDISYFGFGCYTYEGRRASGTSQGEPMARD